MWKIQKTVKPKTDDFGPAGRIEYHILRPDGSLCDIELTYGEAWVRMLVYSNLGK